MVGSGGGGWDGRRGEERRGHLQGFNDDRDSSSCQRSAAKGIRGSVFVYLPALYFEKTVEGHAWGHCLLH